MRPELTQAAELLRQSTPEAIEEAIGLLQGTVFSFSMKVCGHREDAEDNMQEVLSRSLQHLARIGTPEQLAVWLYTVTRNRCWRMRRKSVYAPAHILSLDELMPTQDDLQLLIQSAQNSPEEEVLQQEQSQLLHQAILAVPPILRIVLVLHDMEELSTEQVAQVLDLKAGTVRIRLHRARLSVRKAMQDLIFNSVGKETPPAVSPEARKAKRPADCRELFANLSEYLDGRLEPATCDEMRVHIEACPNCVVFLRDLRTAIDRCRSMDADCDPAVAKRLRTLLTREYLRLTLIPRELAAAV